jgi:3,4-dihydroxy-2-butanone 4-phosphate synthase
METDLIGKYVQRMLGPWTGESSRPSGTPIRRRGDQRGVFARTRLLTAGEEKGTNMALCSIEEAIEDIRQGRMIILVDDENRENEGDLTIAAQSVTPEIINFMAIHGRGLICLAMEPELVEKLDLPMMATRNESRFGTAFTVSIEARSGVSTGISAYDRATTILTAVADDAKAEDIVSPGHVFPAAGQEGRGAGPGRADRGQRGSGPSGRHEVRGGDLRNHARRREHGPNARPGGLSRPGIT